jgi:Ni/Fe-hydrogenase 1 B-type cytochrome subunit
MEPSAVGFRRIYVWERAVRTFHWLNFGSLVTLICTGLIIADPPAIMSGTEATNQYWFGTTRFIHFTAAYIFILALVLRVYWSFVGNKYANWRAFFPYTKKGIHNLLHVLKVDVLLGTPKEFDCTKLAVGHNAMAGISYFGFFLLMLVQIFTGLGLYADMSTWFMPKLFGWVVPMLGGDAEARMVHHVVMWIMIIFSMIHMYLVFFHDWLEARSEVSSMFGGFKFVRRERVKED